MLFLPVIERELRVASHQARTWWRRVLVALVGLVVLALVYFESSRWANAPRIGGEMFIAFSVLVFVFCLLAGPLSTSDCLTAEKQQGTLGLLFLTRLRSHDVVLGKMWGASVSALYGLLALLPLLSLPLLLGGVGLRQLWMAALSFLVVLFLSLATGMFASALVRRSLAAFVLTMIVLAFLTIGLPVIGEEFLGIRLHSHRLAPFFYAPCPLLSMESIFSPGRAPVWRFWLNLGCMSGLSLVLFIASCWLTARAWRDRPPSAAGASWRERIHRWSVGDAQARLAYRRRALNLNPVFWLDDRYRLRKTILWGCFLLFVTFWMVQWQWEGRYWIRYDAVVTVGLSLQYVLGFWLAVEAARRFAEDRQTGALELMVCAPLTNAEIVRGRLKVLCWQFGWVVLASLAFCVFLLIVNVLKWNSVVLYWRDDFTLACLGGIILFPLQLAYTALVGLHQGLTHRTVLQAAFATVWRVLLLPWLAFVLFAIADDLVRHRLGIRIFTLSDKMVILIWFALFLFCGLGFALRAGWCLRTQFRTLAARAVGDRWWWRLLRI